jgi:DNA-binding CsgD family transcriptional regulator
MGLDDRVWDPAQASGLIRRENGALRFIHPLARLVASYSALRDDRRAAHEALGELTSGDSRIWHRARAAAVPDEEVAAGLEQIAVRARDRTAFAAAAQTLERAARLTPDDEARARRLLDAARAARLAGHVTGALDHVDAALRHAVAEEQRGAAERLRGQILARGGSAALARDQLLAVAGRYERSDPAEASEMLADAVLPTLRAGNPGEAVRLARRADRLGESAGGAAPAVRVALGTALVFAGEFTEGRALLDTAAENADEAAEAQQLANLGAGLELAGRHDAARRMLTSVIDDARASGAISILPYALIRLADVHVETGHWSAASAALHEAALLADEMGQAADRGLALGALAWLSGARGQAEDCHALAEQALQIAGRLGGGARLDRAGTAIGMLDLGRGQPDAAIPNLEIACRLQDEQGWSDAARTPHRRPELIEAYALAGRHDEARSALELFRLDAERTERPSALAAWQRGRLALAEAGELDATYAAACAAGAEVWGPFDRARGELLYGTRLVEAGRTDDALSPLACALSAFEDLEARSWTDRARGAILAAGGSIPEPRLSRTERLTPQELEVAAAAADGLSAAEIAERQILGPRTVQMRLASAAIKLGLESPAELAGALRGEPAVAPAR